jgi:hypothetical protein
VLATTAAAEHGRRQAALVRKAAAGVLQASGFFGSTREGPVKTLRGSGRPGDHWRGAIAAEENLTVGGLGSNSGRCSGRRRGWNPRDASWRRGEDVAGLGRGWGAAEQRVRGGAEALSGGAGRLRCQASVVAVGLGLGLRGAWGCYL